MTDIQEEEQRPLKRQRDDDLDAPKRTLARAHDNAHASDDGVRDNDPVMDAALEIQNELIKVDTESMEAIAKVHKEYEYKKQPYYAKRSTVLSQIDSFWYTVLAQSGVKAYISEDDKNVLAYLHSLDVSMVNDNGSYVIALTFAEDNPYFQDPTLTRTVSKNPEEGTAEVECSGVKWKPGQNLQTTMDEHGRPLLASFTFINWFTTEGIYDDIDGDMIAEDIRLSIWPNPLNYFTGDMDIDVDVELEEGGGEGLEVEVDGFDGDGDLDEDEEDEEAAEEDLGDYDDEEEEDVDDGDGDAL